MTGFQVQNAIHYPFAIDRNAGRVREEADYEAYVRQLIRQVLLTNLGERINRPQFGSDIRRLVFAPLDPTTTGYVKSLVYQALTRWLANFIRPENIDVTVVESTLEVNIEYTVIARGERRFLNVEITL